jgi:hypothetical protein
MDLGRVDRAVVVPLRADPLGVRGPTPKQARGPRWRRSSKGLFVPAGVDGTDVEQRIVEAAAVLPEDWGGVTGWAALAWCGGTWFDGSPWGGGPVAPVTLAVGGNRAIRAQRTFHTSEERLAPHELVVVDGLRITTLVRSVCFEMRYAPDVRQAAICLSMACFHDLVSIEEAADFASTISGWTGVPRCRDAIPMATENAWSPRELGMLHVWQYDGGYPRPLCNVPVFGPDGSLLGTPDLIDPVAGVVGEYDGSLHLHGEQRRVDQEREHLFRSHGLEYTTMLAGDVRDPSGFLRRLAAAYDRAADIPPSRRTWTIEQPPWWTDTSTVAARRALDAASRARLLRYRRAS